MTADITRLFPDRDTRYHALVRQQGRLPIDAEENFASDIAEWERDDAFVETIAPAGSPDDGFRISAPAGGATPDFTVAAGSYYLGGLRVENPVALTYRNQRLRNWLGFPLDAEGGNEALPNARRFLVWLDAFDQTVTATEDAELRDPGLGGPDGVAARRMGWRVRATPVAGLNCVAARAQWLAAMGWAGRVDAATGALRSGSTLTVAFNPAAVDQDLCAPSLTPGFLGARNECLRVMVSAPGRYVWGRDDAAPVYRVRVEAIAGQLRRVVFLTEPRDEHLRPRQGQTVELLRWDERLPNAQKTAEPVGRFFSVASGFADGAITLTSAVDIAWTAWLAALPAGALSGEDAAGEQRYFYLRLWTGGGSGGQADVAQAAGDLAGTGLRLSFSAGTMVGEHWVLAARPNAPTQLLPWSLKAGKAADGPRRHVVPLAFVDLDAGTVVDCRRRFRPLYKQGGCCTVTVGDDENSWGDVSTIAEALARLPASGGEICLGPGTWRENVVVEGRRNIVFSGCGRRTRWLAADPALPPLVLRGVENLRVRRIAFESATAPCVIAQPTVVQQQVQACRDVVLEDCLLATPSGGVVRATGMQGFMVEGCLLESGPMADPNGANAVFAALTMHGERLVLRRSQVLARLGATPQTLALGGVHVAGGSHDVTIEHNRIADGAGNGVTLGSVRLVTLPAPAFTADPDAALDEAVGAAGGPFVINGFRVSFDPAGCIRFEPVDPNPTPGGGGTVQVPISDGMVTRTLIAHNRIEGQGANGIATFPLLPIDAQGRPAWDGVAVEGLEVTHNDILGNVRREPAPLPPLQRLFAGLGGVALGMASDVTLRDNRIQDNGAEPSRAACGVFIGYGEAVRIERNQIERNGALPAELGGSVGGIVVRAAYGGAEASDSFDAQTTDRPALLVHGNVVHAPRGRALKVLARGPVMVADNRLTGANASLLFGNPLQALVLLLLGLQSAGDVLGKPEDPALPDLLLFDAAIDIMGGDAVSIVNLSVVEEFLLVYTFGRLFGSVTNASSLASAGRKLAKGLNPGLFRGGETQFCDNQVVLRGGLGKPPAHLSSTLIIALDDIAFADNQCELDADVAFSLADTLLLGASLRATGNRLQASVPCLLSLGTLALGMNTTAMNQATFLIAANGPKLVNTGNLTVV